MTNWTTSGEPAAWRTASSRCPAMPRESTVPVIAAMRSIHTPVDWFATLLPPGSAAAFADQSGLTYIFAPAYGLSTRLPGPGPGPGSLVVVVVVVVVGG